NRQICDYSASNGCKRPTAKGILSRRLRAVLPSGFLETLRAIRPELFGSWAKRLLLFGRAERCWVMGAGALMLIGLALASHPVSANFDDYGQTSEAADSVTISLENLESSTSAGVGLFGANSLYHLDDDSYWANPMTKLNLASAHISSLR